MSYIRRFLLLILAVAFIVIGILGMVLPIIHGTFFLLIGIILFSFESPYVEKKMLSFVSRHKKIHEIYVKIDTTLRRWFGR